MTMRILSIEQLISYFIIAVRIFQKDTVLYFGFKMC